MGEFGDDKNFPLTKGATSKALLGGDNVGPSGLDGKDSVVATAHPWHLALPCDSDGSNVDYTDPYIYIMITEGSSVIADGVTNNGWTATIESNTNCTVVIVSGLKIQITSMTDNSASYKLKLSHSDYDDIYITGKAAKIHKGTTGDTGDTGTQGDQGDQGDIGVTGSAGTGLVIVKKSIIMTDFENLESVASNSDGLLFTTVGDHYLSVGDTVLNSGFSSYPVYDGYHRVTEVNSSNEYRIVDISYAGNDTGIMYNKSAFKFIDDDEKLDLMWLDILPYGASLLQLKVICINEGNDENEIYVYVGTAKNPATGWNSYINGEILESEDDMVQYPAINQPMNVNALVGINTSKTDIHMRVAPYSGKDWDPDYIGKKFNLIIAYIAFDPDALGSS